MLTLPSNKVRTLPAISSLSVRTNTLQTETMIVRLLVIHSSWYILSSVSFGAGVHCCAEARELLHDEAAARAVDSIMDNLVDRCYVACW
uniref:Uncharacterized protein n=1 Tax=Oryza glaberrima TaxID=4538 RepID=I1QG53_ORYGL